MEEITAIFCRERIRWENTLIAECDWPPSDAPDAHPPHPLSLIRSGVLVKCQAEIDELRAGLSYRWYGHWQEHHKHGKQFVAKTFVRCQPHGQTGTIRYLMLAPHVGRATATMLWDTFGGDAVRILRETPDVAATAVGGQFTAARAVEAAEWLKEEAAMEGVTIDLMDLLAGRGFPRDTAKKAVGEWGNRAAVLLRKNPYLLMRFRGCGFLRTDAMYVDRGGNPDALKRQALCAWYALARDTEGHTWHSPSVAEAGMRANVAGTAVRVVPALQLARRAALVAVHRPGDGTTWIAEGRKARNEASVAERLRELAAGLPQWPSVAELDASPHQRDQLSRAAQGPVAIFTGSPGTGKTYTAARLIDTLGQRFGLANVAVAAPTGKAAVRITEAMQGYGVNIRATTIHRLLGVESRSAGDGWAFRYQEDCPLPYRFVVVDESSMIDTDLMAALLRACARGTHLLFVGDTNQLPPVGHGAPLRDMIAAGLPCGELRQIVRQQAGSSIVQACAAIRDGRHFRTDEALAPGIGQNLKLVPTRDNVWTAARIGELLGQLRRAGHDPVWDCQVIVAVNRKSELSRHDLNKQLQRLLNPAGQRAGTSPFRTGDKLVCLKNGFLPVADCAAPDENQEAVDGKVFLANGEQGRVVDVADKLTTVRLTAPKRCIKVPRGDARESTSGASHANNSGNDGNGNDGNDMSAATGCNFDLAYAISCHKSQGSEWPVVLVGLDEYPGARYVCSREWLYTAISRAKKLCLLVGKRATADGMCLRQAIQRRKTFLKELIQGG